MQKNNFDYNGDITVSPAPPFVYRRPRSLVRHLARRLNFRNVARLTAQSLVSASFISGGIIVTQAAGLNPIGAFLALTGVGLALGEEDTQTPEEYRQFVISHFQKRGETPPRWTQVVKIGQTWRHRGILNFVLKRCYLVISVRHNVARCLVIDTDGEPIYDSDGEALILNIRTFTMRYAYREVRR